MSTNQFKPFATGVGANVRDISTYIANTSLVGGGNPDGAMPTAKDFNRMMRQACFGTAALGELIKANSVDALDDGDMATFVSHLKSALAANVVDSLSLGNTGYVKTTASGPFGGLTLQWGRVVTGLTQASYSLTFPVAFTTACYVVIPIVNATSVQTTDIFGSDTPTTTGVTIWGSTDTDINTLMNFFWIAIGK